LLSSFVLACLLLTARLSQAQVDNYTFAPSTGTYTQLPATATVVAAVQADDAISAALPIGFTFVFDGTPYTSFYASSNGFLSFNSSASSTNANNLTTGAASIRPLIAPLWDDLGGGNAASVASYQLTGTAPNRVLTFEWRNWLWRYTGTAPAISFQAKLYEGTNRIEFIYRPEAATPSTPTASIGLAGVGTGNGSFLSLSDSTPAPTASSTVENAAIATAPAAGQVYAFTPAAPSLCPSPRNLTVSTITNASATVSFTVTNTTPGPFTILYGPTGFNPNAVASSTNVYSTITATSTTATLTGLTAQTGYQFYVVQNCGGTNGNSAISNVGSFTTNPNPAANDNCAQALPLSVGTSCTTPLSGTVFGATQSLAPTTNCGSTVANDVWYSFVASASALQLTTGAQFFGYYDVRSGTCATSTSVTCGALGTTATPLQGLISGLTVGQTYFVRVYSTSTTTATASTFTLCLTPLQNYCNTGLGGFCGGNDITAVSIAGTTLNATGLTCTTTAGQSYTNYPATGANTATLQSGVPYQLSVAVDATSIVSVWIDYNRNLIFEASEWTQLTTNAGTTPTIATINIPTNAVQGPTGMRIRSRANGNSNGATDACTNFGSGETKDFTVTIGPPAACPTASNVTATAITSTSASLTFTSSASAVSYTLTLTPQNGTATTRTVTASPVSLTPLLPNTTYTISLVSNCTGSTTSPPVILTFTTLPTPAPNDECTTAVALTVAATCTPTTGTVFGATQSLAPTASCGFGITTANDVWYSFVATSTSHTLTINPQFAAAYDVRSGACANTTSIFCNTATSGIATNRTIGGLTVGQTYFIRVYASGTVPTATTSSFTLCVVPGPATPANDDCAGAINVPIQFVTCTTQVSADNTAATSSTGVSAPTCANYVSNDLWFKATVPVTGAVTIQTVAPTVSSNVTDTGLTVYSGTCGTLTDIGCNDDSNGTLYSSLTFANRTPGEVLYIRVWAYGGNSNGLIAVCVTSPSNCAAPTGPSVGTTTNTTAVLNWVAPTGSTTGNTYEIEYGPQNFTQGTGTLLTNLTATTSTITGLTPATAYCFYVRQNCGTTNGSSAWVGPTCFTTPLTAPLNDDPCGAIGLGTGPRTGSNVGALTSTQNGITFPICSPSSAPKDVWFSFVASATTASFTVTGTPAGMVRVYASPSCSAGPFALVSCAASGANNTALSAPVTATGLTVGTRYYIAVSGYGSSDTAGAFTITPTAGVLAARAQADSDALLVYPNPSSTGQLTLKLALGNGRGQAALLNALGQVVRTTALTAAPEQTLDTRTLATGVYTLRVEANGQVLTRKVVLE
jgi:hypothetical protein